MLILRETMKTEEILKIITTMKEPYLNDKKKYRRELDTLNNVYDMVVEWSIYGDNSK